jgi:uncharacterized membrane protein YGL010W
MRFQQFPHPGAIILHGIGIAFIDKDLVSQKEVMTMETINEVLGGAAVAPWEILFFLAAVVIYTYLERRKSALQVTFIFTFYWGFKNLMAFFTVSAAKSQSLVLLYVGWALAIFGLMSANYLTQKSSNVQPVEV